MTDPADDDLVDVLVQMAFEVTAVLQRVAATHDLSLTQVRVLGILRDRRLRMSVLADFLGLERSTLSGLVDRAAERDLVVRSPSPGDGRVTEVTLSRAGRRLAARLYDDVVVALRPGIARLSAPEAARVQFLLRRLLRDGPA